MGCCASKKDGKRGGAVGGDDIPTEDTAFSGRLAEIYKKYDKDGDGCLDRNETRELLNTVMKDQGRNVDDKDIDEFIRAADANNDGKIQKKELYQLYKKLERSQQSR